MYIVWLCLYIPSSHIQSLFLRLFSSFSSFDSHLQCWYHCLSNPSLDCSNKVLLILQYTPCWGCFFQWILKIWFSSKTAFSTVKVKQTKCSIFVVTSWVYTQCNDFSKYDVYFILAFGKHPLSFINPGESFSTSANQNLSYPNGSTIQCGYTCSSQATPTLSSATIRVRN